MAISHSLSVKSDTYGHNEILIRYKSGSFAARAKSGIYSSPEWFNFVTGKSWIIFKLHRQVSEDDMIDQIFERHCRRQADINNAGGKQILIC